MPTRTDDLPRTIKRSPAKARRIYAKTHDNAVEEYGEGERAHRTAMAALKRSFEKVGDHWEPKEEPGPSDERAVRNHRGLRNSGRTAGGVDVEGHTKRELYERARRLGVRGRSRMTKQELGEAIARAES
jgi:cation transport regulator ChaB